MIASKWAEVCYKVGPYEKRLGSNVIQFFRVVQLLYAELNRSNWFKQVTRLGSYYQRVSFQHRVFMLATLKFVNDIGS